MKDHISQESITDKLFNMIKDENDQLSLNQIKHRLDEMSPPEIAHSIESMPPKERTLLWSLVNKEKEGEILSELHDEIQQELLAEIKPDDLVDIISDLELDELVDILQGLSKTQIEDFLSRISYQDRIRIEAVLEYPEDSAGGLLNTDVISITPKDTLEDVIRYLRAKKELPQNTDKIFVVSKEDKYLGELPISKILVSDPGLSVKDVMETNIQPIFALTDDKQVSRQFEQNNWVSAGVIDEQNKLLGRITVDDVVDVIREDADQNLMGMTGIAEDTFAAPARAARSRVIWLSINLFTAFIAAITINLFQDTIEKLVYLAVLMPVVASMGGVAATQTLTIVIRGLTLQQIGKSNIKWLFKRELAVSIINGILLSFLIAVITYLWFEEIVLSILICLALVINLISSVIAGIFVPMVLRKMKQDPAIAGSVVVTTVTDVVGFFSFLGLAAIFLF
tara:strand:- start:9568 stop:10923 length:1356 start_codon:yes stop_codon:yes gene_type:complete